MDRSKWILAMGIVAMMLAVGVFIPADTDVEGDTPTADSSWYNSSQISFDIYDVGDLLAFADAVNGKDDVTAVDFSGKTVNLCASLDISEITSWTPIGKGTRSGGTASGTPFKGTFNGNDYVISGLKISSAGSSDAVGLFGIVNAGAVNNVILEGITISASGNGNIGAIAGVLCGNGTISNCVSGSNSIVSTKSTITGDEAGGIVGRVLYNGQVINCQNFTEISGTGKCGGIANAAYYAETNSRITIENCQNYASITSTGGYTGGIVGLSAAFVTNCINIGNVQGGSDSVGGIIGEQKAYGEVQGSINYASVTSTGGSGTAGTGGIIGWLRYVGDEGGAYKAYNTVTVNKCINYGDISSSGYSVGGIIGLMYEHGNVTNNINLAQNISSTSTKAETGEESNVGFAAGILTYQAIGTQIPDIDRGFQCSGNVSTTVESNIKGKNTTLYIYDNSSSSTDKDSTNVTPSWFTPQSKPAIPIVVSRSQAPIMSINPSIESPEVGDRVTLTAINSNPYNVSYAYEWSTGSSSKAIDITLSGQYTVTVTISDGIRTFLGSSTLEITFADKIEKTEDESGTTTTVTKKEDGTTVTVTEDSAGASITTKTENSDGTKVTTEIVNSEGTSLTTETKTEVKEETSSAVISTTTIVVKDTEEEVTSAEAKAEVKVEQSSESTTGVVVSQTIVEAALKTITDEELVQSVEVSKTISVVAADTTQISLTAEATQAVSDSSASLEFVGSAGTLTADAKVVETLASQGDSLTISFVKTDDVVLPDTQQTVEDPTAYRLTVTKSDGSTVHELNGNVDLTVEYEPPASVTASEVVVIYVDDDGTMEAMTTTYDPDTKILKFSTDHFSYFMVGTKSMLEPTEPDVKPPIFIVIPDSGDDSVPIVIVDQDTTSESDDGSAKTVACAVAAVVVVIMLLFLARDTRTK